METNGCVHKFFLGSMKGHMYTLFFFCSGKSVIDDTDNVDDILWVVDDCGLSDVADCAIDLLGRGNIEELSFFESL